MGHIVPPDRGCARVPGRTLGAARMSAAKQETHRATGLDHCGPSCARQRLGRNLAAVPFTLGVLAIFLVTAAATGSFLAGPPEHLLEVAGVSRPGLQAGSWWSLFTSLFFATNPLAYLAASLMIVVLLGLAERRLGTKAAIGLLVLGQFAAVTLFLLVTQLAGCGGGRLAGPDGGRCPDRPVWPGPRCRTGRQCPAPGPVAAPAPDRGAFHLAAAGPVCGPRGNRHRPDRGVAGPAGRMVDPGRRRATRTGTAPPAAKPGTSWP